MAPGKSKVRGLWAEKSPLLANSGEKSLRSPRWSDRNPSATGHHARIAKTPRRVNAGEFCGLVNEIETVIFVKVSTDVDGHNSTGSSYYYMS